MSVIFILIACSMLLAAGFLIAFLWASRSGQYEDDYSPSVRMLYDDEEISSSSSKKASKEEKGKKRKI